MGGRRVGEDFSLLGSALAAAAREAQTLKSLAAKLDAAPEELSVCWIAVNSLRRHQGCALPVPFEALRPDEASEAASASCNWYAPTWRLGKLLEEFQVNEGLAAHYGRILTDPEGGHFELNLAASEVVRATRLEGAEVDEGRLRRVCVQACEPSNGMELLVSNAGKILITTEEHRGEPLSASFVEGLYAKLVKGIAIKDDGDPRQRARALEAFCSFACGQGDPHAGLDCGGCSHTLVVALVGLYYFKTFKLFPAGNAVLAYLLYFLILHRAGYHFSAHVSVLKLLYPSGEVERGRGLECAPEDLAVACDGHFDWTRFFERAVSLIVGEQRWTMAKLDGMARRRERFRVIIDADESMNFRQKEVLLEAVLHSNAEFTYGIHEQRYDVSYPCARSDFARLLDQGFLRQHDDGIRHFFVASDTFEEAFLEYLKTHCAEAFHRYYRDDGALRDEHKGTGDIVAEYNKDVGFYEKSLLDKTYIEHYDFRRTPIADHDGPRKRRSDDG